MLVISWILNSVEPSIALNLRPYKTAAETCDYLSRVYSHQNDARWFYLEYEIVEYNQADNIITMTLSYSIFAFQSALIAN